MARKKQSRKPRPAASPTAPLLGTANATPVSIATAPAPTASATAVTTTPLAPPVQRAEPAPRPRPPIPPRPRTEPARSADPETLVDLGKTLWGVVKSLGSLKVAVISLTLFVIAMAAGTMVESWYTGKLARDLVYSSWWFVILLGVLFVNILFAAVKKWPWKRHQLGFLITHLGLLTMLTGGVFTWLNSTDHLMALVDTTDSRFQEFAGPQTSRVAIAPEESSFEITRKGEKDSRILPFNPGLLPWRSDPAVGFKARTDMFLAVLDTIAHPFPRGYSRVFDWSDGARIDVLNYFPHARAERYRKANAGESGYPALKFSIENSMGMDFEGWVSRPPADSRFAESPLRDRQVSRGPSRVEFVGTENLSPMQANEFLHPPGRTPKGILALQLGEAVTRVDVAKTLEEKKPVPLSKEGWTVEVTGYSSNDGPEAGHGGKATFPVVHYTVRGPAGEAVEYTSHGFFGDLKVGKSIDEVVRERVDAELDVWYHAPDPGFGATEDPEQNLRGLLQFAVRAKDKAVLFRAFHTGKGMADRTPGGDLTLETSGSVAVGDDPKPIWKKMDWRLRLTEAQPNMVKLPPNSPRWVPENRRPGLDTAGAGLSAVAQCRVTIGGKSTDFWVPRSEGGSTTVTVGKDTMQVAFRPQKVTLPFELHLMRAEQTNDPGTNSAATYTSYVRLNDTSRSIFGEYNIRNEEHVITMNEPLEHRGYKFYQTNYSNFGLDPKGKPVNGSTLTVGSDFPGLQMKYLGTAMLALGIATMFYMRAYTLGPRKRPTTTAGKPEDKTATTATTPEGN